MALKIDASDGISDFFVMSDLSTGPKREAKEGTLSGLLFSGFLVCPSFLLLLLLLGVLLLLLLLSVASSASPKRELRRLIFAWLAEIGFGGGVTEGFDAFCLAAFVVVVVLFVVLGLILYNFFCCNCKLCLPRF